MKKVLSTAVALGFCLYLPAVALAGAGGSQSNDEILRQLKELQAIVSSQQAEIDRLKEQKAAPVAQQEHIDAEKKKGFAVSGNEFIDGIKIKGDMRLRYDVRDKEYKEGMGEDLTRERFRTRFRLGGIWDNKEESWQVGAGLASGGDDPTSTNDTWSEVKTFETGDIRLDYAYGKHKWDDVSMTLGQHENPYKSSWVFWDSNVRLAGMTMAYGPKEGLFATGGAYAAKLVQDDDTAMLYMGQLGYNGKFGEKGKFAVSTGYHTYSHELISEQNALFKLESVDPEVYELNIGDIYGDVSLPVGPVNMKLYGQAWMNFGADGEIGESQAGSKFPETPEDNDMGWITGVDASINSFKMGLAYYVIEADSLFGYLSDSASSDGLVTTNRQGWRALLGYNITKNWSADFFYYNIERDEDYAAAKEDQVNVYQFEVNYKF